MQGKIFRIGHLGWFNDLMLCGTLAGVEMGLELASVPHRNGGVQVATEYLARTAATELARAAQPTRRFDASKATAGCRDVPGSRTAESDFR